MPETPADSPLTMDEAVTLNRNLSTAKLAVGETAFPFALPRLDADGAQQRGETVRLEDLRRDRPVALIFGSYT
jgi:hypothetical protein